MQEDFEALGMRLQGLLSELTASWFWSTLTMKQILPGRFIGKRWKWPKG